MIEQAYLLMDSTNIRHIDARIKLLQAILMGFLMFLLRSSLSVLASVIVMAFFLIFFGVYQTAMKMCLLGLACFTSVTLWSSSSNVILGIIAFVSFMFLKFTPMYGVFVIMTRTICANELISALEKLHLSRKVTLTLAVTLRFIPTIRLEFTYIKDSMLTRGIPLTIGNVLKQPLMMSEYVLIPLLMRFAKVAEELAAAAVTRGVERPGKRGALQELKIRKQDWLYLFFMLITFLMLLVIQQRWGG